MHIEGTIQQAKRGLMRNREFVNSVFTEIKTELMPDPQLL